MRKLETDLIYDGFNRSNIDKTIYTPKDRYIFHEKLFYLYIRISPVGRWVLIYLRDDIMEFPEAQLHTLFAGNIENYADFVVIMKSWKHLKQ